MAKWLERELSIALFVGIDAGVAWLVSWAFDVDFLWAFMGAVAFSANSALLGRSS